MAFEVDYFTIDSTQATNRKVSLTGIPSSATDVAMDLCGGTAQAITSDFAVDGTNVKWDSTVYGLYGVISTGDKVRVIYDRS